ncbi:hypothetical protein V2J09_023731 [Rumex salicifolius]
MKSYKPYIAVLFIMVVYAGNALISKVAMIKGMSPLVFVVYRQAFATLTLAPLAYFSESGKGPPLSFSVLCKIFLVSLCGITSSLDLFYEGINYTSATFAAACTNAIPAITFVLAVLLRVETMSIKQVFGVAKVLGTIVGLCGAMVFAFVRGPPLKLMGWDRSGQGRVDVSSHGSGEWVKGSLMMFGANAAWSMWLILQGPIMRHYPSKLRLTALQCFFSFIQSGLFAILMDRNLSSWRIGWDLNLFSVAYCGIIVSGMTYWLQIWVIDKKGPVFLASFTPLSLVLTAIISAFMWKETIFWGRIWGALLLVVGLYSVLWGKNKEADNLIKAEEEANDEEKLKQPQPYIKEDTL